jgi:hypothetical protein
MRGLLSILFLASMSSSACSYFPETYNVSNDFRVQLANPTGPVAGIIVRIGKKEARTDAAGYAQFHLEDGNYTLEVIHPAARLSWWGISVSSKEANREVIFKWPQKVLVVSKVSGTLLDGLFSSKSKPMAGATLSMVDITGKNTVGSKQVLSDDGRFDFPNLSNGLYFLKVSEKGLKNWDDNSWISRGYVPMFVSATTGQGDLKIATQYSSCGFDFDLENNKDKYKPQFCIKGGKEIPCES